MPVSESTKGLITGLTIRYVSVLLLLATLAIASHFTMVRMVYNDESDAALINLSGRQRMLLQRIILLAENLNEVKNTAELQKDRNELQRLTTLMEKSHDALINGNLQMLITNPLPRALRPLFFGPEAFLDRDLRQFTKVVKDLIADYQVLTPVESIHLKYIQQVANTTLARDLNAVVTRYQSEDERHIKTLYKIFNIFLGSVLVVLAFSAFGVFRPMVRRVACELDARKKVEEKQRRSVSRLAESNAMLSEFAYAVTHDLKAPLRAVHNYSDFLRDDLDGTLDDEQQQYLDGIDKAVCESDHLIDDLLAYSRVSSGDAPYEKINIGDFLRKIIDSMSLDADIDISIFCHCTGCIVVKTSPVLLKQIATNLISNAIKYNNCAKKCLEISCRTEGDDYCKISFKDNGIGIDTRFFNKIFDIFQRLHAKNEYQGTGIGLAIVRKAISRLDGHIKIESTTGKGSVFHVTLPLSSTEEDNADNG